MTLLYKFNDCDHVGLVTYSRSKGTVLLKEGCYLDYKNSPQVVGEKFGYSDKFKITVVDDNVSLMEVKETMPEYFL